MIFTHASSIRSSVSRQLVGAAIRAAGLKRADARASSRYDLLTRLC